MIVEEDRYFLQTENYSLEDKKDRLSLLYSFRWTKSLFIPLLKLKEFLKIGIIKMKASTN